MNKTILTAAGPHMMPVLENFSLPSFEQFGRRNDYDVTVIRHQNDSLMRKDSLAVAARWQKMKLIKDALATYDIVLWLDADVILQRFDEDPLLYLEEDHYQGLVLHHVPAENRVNPNTGVWLLRREARTFNFLDKIESIGLPEGRWADQGAVMRALDWECGDEHYSGARYPSDDRQLDGVAWLPTGWNQPYTLNRPNPEAYEGRPLVSHPHAVHFMSMTIKDRMKEMDTFNHAHPIEKRNGYHGAYALCS